MVLDLVRKVRTLGLRHVYLGYWIAESRKMAYKTRYRPCEILTGHDWTEFPGS
jgi:arginine-tRNA-protein transferase